MSTLPAISIYYNEKPQNSINKILKSLLESGWNLNDYGHISILPLGDKDAYNWKDLGIDQEDDAFRIINEKVTQKENPGLVLMWKDSMVGFVSTFYPAENRMDALFTINRQELPGLSAWTDVSWYLIRILPSIINAGIIINRIEYSETQ